MKLSKASAVSIENVLRTAKLIDVNEMKITNTNVSGYNTDRSAFIFSPHTIVEDIGVMAIKRLDVYLARYDIIKDMDDSEIIITTQGDGDDRICKQLDLNAKRIKLQYRFGSHTMIQAPTAVKDNELYTIKIDEEITSLITKASIGAESPKVELSCSNGELTYNLVDLSNDLLCIESDEKVVTEGDGVCNFTHSYALKMFIQLMKNTTDNEFCIGAKGLLKVNVNNLDFYMLPRV